MQLAIITGASSGLGKEFAIQIAKKYYQEVDEIWLIARRREKLEQLAAFINTNSHVTAHAVPMDLTNTECTDRLEQMIADAGAQVSYLVNAAGLGKFGGPEELTRAEQRNMIDLNCRAAVDVTALCIPYLKEGAHILQICSTAGFQPLQYLNIYAASKSFLMRYSEALSWELMDRHVHVTAVCPYWVKDTEFIGIAKSVSSKKSNKHYPLSGNSKTTVAWALASNRIGWWVCTPSPVSFIHRLWTKVTPPILQLAVYEIVRRL